MRSISHWGMFESFDKEVKVAYSPEYLRECVERQARYYDFLNGNAENAIFQRINFGKLD